MENKLKKQIYDKLEQYGNVMAMKILTDDLYLLVSDVSKRFSEWCSWKYLLGSDGKTWIPRFTDQRKQENWRTTDQLLSEYLNSIYGN